MKVFNLCAKVTKRHLVSLGVYLGIFAVLAVMLTAFNNTSQSLSFEAVRPSAAIVNRDGESALVRGLEDFLAGYADMVKLEISGPLSPMKVVPMEGDSFLFLVLPMKLKTE